MPSGVEHSDINILKAIQELYRLKPGLRIATTKLDGIRGMCFGQLGSRVLKLIPNKVLQEKNCVLPNILLTCKNYGQPQLRNLLLFI
jgi:hypothetical protein